MRRAKCPQGYQMVNGNCQEVVSSIPGGGGGAPSLDCDVLCQGHLPGSCAETCSCSCCYGYWVNQPGGGHDFAPEASAEWQCNCGGCMSEYWQCIAGCFSNANPIINRGGMGRIWGGRGWKKGGKINGRRRRRR